MNSILNSNSGISGVSFKDFYRICMYFSSDVAINLNQPSFQPLVISTLTLKNEVIDLPFFALVLGIELNKKLILEPRSIWMDLRIAKKILFTKSVKVAKTDSTTENVFLYSLLQMRNTFLGFNYIKFSCFYDAASTRTSLLLTLLRIFKTYKTYLFKTSVTDVMVVTDVCTF